MILKRLSLGCIFLALLPLSILGQAGANDKAEQSEQYAETGQQALAAGQYAIAQSNFEKLVALQPRVAEVHATLAVIYFKQREYDQAIRAIHTAQKLKPGLPKLDSLLGMSLAELGRFQDALPGLEKGFKQSADPEVRRMCGLQLLRAYTGLNRDADAVETSLALNKYYPKDPEVLYHTGRIYGNIAYVTMETLHDTAPDSIWMLQAQGEANESEKNYEAAIIAFNHVLVLDPHRPSIHYRIGRIHLRQFQEAHRPEDREEAIKEFQAELAVDPAQGNAAYELANLNLDAGNLEEAQKGFEQVIARFPDFEEALVGLGGVLLQDQKAPQALPLLQHATQVKPDDEVAWYRLALAERGVGNKAARQKAIAKYQELRKVRALTEPRVPTGDEVTPQKVGASPEP
jgi:tetratricopeptide (TPR) repeat protein